MQAMAQSISTVASTYWESTTTKTTLYELIEAISEELLPGEDRLVTEVVLHLLNTEKIKFLGDLGKIRKVIEESNDAEKSEYNPIYYHCGGNHE